MGESRTMRDAEARRALKDDLHRLYCRVQQPEDPPLFTREPHSRMEPVHWRWGELSPMLDRLGPLRPGDTVTIAIDSIGELTLAVREQPERAPRGY